MATAIFMAIIGAIFATQLVNPFYIKRFFTYIDMYLKEELPNDEDKENTKRWEKFKALKVDNVENFMLNQIISFIIAVFVLTIGYVLFCLPRNLGSFLACLLVPAIILILNFLFMEKDYVFRSSKTNDIVFKNSLKAATVMIVISAITILSSPLYDIINPKAPVFNESLEQPATYSINVNDILKDVEIPGDTSFGEVIYNENEVIVFFNNGYWLKGFVKIDKNGQYEIVEKDINYNNIECLFKTDVEYIARNALPAAVFFGDFSYQYSPNGNIYSACLYGNHIFLKAGRNIQGIVLVDCETGKVSTMPINDVPDWIHIEN